MLKILWAGVGMSYEIVVAHNVQFFLLFFFFSFFTSPKKRPSQATWSSEGRVKPSTVKKCLGPFAKVDYNSTITCSNHEKFIQFRFNYYKYLKPSFTLSIYLGLLNWFKQPHRCIEDC